MLYFHLKMELMILVIVFVIDVTIPVKIEVMPVAGITVDDWEITLTPSGSLKQVPQFVHCQYSIFPLLSALADFAATCFRLWPVATVTTLSGDIAAVHVASP